MFKIIRDSGGVAGINLYPLFLTDRNTSTSKEALMHINHFLSLDGADSIGIGADFDGTDNQLPYDVQGCEGLHRILDLVNKETVDKISHKNFMRVFGEG